MHIISGFAGFVRNIPLKKPRVTSILMSFVLMVKQLMDMRSRSVAKGQSHKRGSVRKAWPKASASGAQPLARQTKNP
ncbi:MAG: hypothetical protein F6K55_31915 [Moorea sp. SIO4A3]|nr:hypothetical protein [Moorena sp. SIO4A3]